MGGGPPSLGTVANLASYAALELFIAAIAVALPTVFSAFDPLIASGHMPTAPAPQFRDRSRRGKPDAAWHSRGRDGRDLPDCGRVARAPPGCAVAGSAVRAAIDGRRALCREHGGCCRRSDRRRVLADSLVRHSRDDMDWSLAEYRGGLRSTVARSRSASTRSCAHDAATRPAHGAAPAHVHAAPLARRGCRRRLGFAALVYEVAWTRLLALIIGPTTYAFALMAASFISGIALGSNLGVRLARRNSNVPLWLAAMLLGHCRRSFLAAWFTASRLPLIVAHQIAAATAFGPLLFREALSMVILLMPASISLGATFTLGPRHGLIAGDRDRRAGKRLALYVVQHSRRCCRGAGAGFVF